MGNDVRRDVDALLLSRVRVWSLMAADDRIALGISRDPAVLDGAAWDDLFARAQGMLRAAVGGGMPVEARCRAGSALVVTGSLARDLPSPAQAATAVVPSGPVIVRADGTRPALGRLGDAGLREVEAELADAVPPFAYLALDGREEAVGAGTDHLGLQHVYVAQATGYAVVSTSSTIAARLTGSGLDERACGVYSLIGNFLHDRTMFDRVRKLGPAETVTLVEGRVASRVDRSRVPVMVRRSGLFASQDEAVAEGAAVLDDVVGALAAGHPRPLLELSGGLDSRVLAAVAQRCGFEAVHTLTIGVPGDPDVTLAARIADGAGFDPTFVPVSILDDLEPPAALHRVRLAACQREFAADPVSGALYDAVEASVPASAQVSGIGGELARGNYYTGQGMLPRFDRDLVEKVVRWRLVSNFSASADLFDREFRRSADAALREDAWAYVADLDVPWPVVTDEFYLFGRLQPWGGAVYSRRGADRQILAPLYHPRFVDWASRIPLELKRNSRTFAALLQRIAPELARMPLDSGLSPAQLAGRGLRSRAATHAGDARRVVRKVRRQLARRGKSAVGTRRLAAGLLEAWRADPPHELAASAWLDQGAVERALDGRLPLGTPSVAFLANLSSALREIGDAA